MGSEENFLTMNSVNSITVRRNALIAGTMLHQSEIGPAIESYANKESAVSFFF